MTIFQQCHHPPLQSSSCLPAPAAAPGPPPPSGRPRPRPRRGLRVAPSSIGGGPVVVAAVLLLVVPLLSEADQSPPLSHDDDRRRILFCTFLQITAAAASHSHPSKRSSPSSSHNRPLPHLPSSHLNNSQTHSCEVSLFSREFHALSRCLTVRFPRLPPRIWHTFFPVYFAGRANFVPELMV